MTVLGYIILITFILLWGYSVFGMKSKENDGLFIKIIENVNNAVLMLVAVAFIWYYFMDCAYGLGENEKITYVDSTRIETPINYVEIDSLNNFEEGFYLCYVQHTDSTTRIYQVLETNTTLTILNDSIPSFKYYTEENKEPIRLKWMYKNALNYDKEHLNEVDTLFILE
jgi:hypothetical protein